MEHWYKLVEYAERTFSLAGVSYIAYIVTQHQIFTAPRGKGWSDALLMMRLLFTVPVSNAKLERMYTKLKRVKTNSHCSLGIKCLENILRIMEEGSNSENFDPISTIEKWNIDKVRCTNEEKHYVQSVQKYGVFSDPYFPVFGLNTGKYGPEKTPYLDTFHAVKGSRSYKSHNSTKVNVKSLSDDSYNEEEIFLKMGTKKNMFSSDSE